MTLTRLIDIVKEASRLMTVDNFEVAQKDGFANIVTSSDLAVQEFLRRRLNEELPGSGFICEEDDIRDTAHDDVWIIDPIDGTANYARGFGQCAVCVGLRSAGRMKMAVVWLPRTGELFAAERDKGATLNGRPIHVSQRPFADSILCTALPLYHKEHTADMSRIITGLFTRINDIRRFGAAAPELCYLAAGRCELFLEYLLSPWDFAAASLIVEEAGGVLARPDGYPLDPTRPSGVVAANNPEALKSLLEASKGL